MQLVQKIDTRTRDWKSKSLIGTNWGMADALVPKPPEGMKPTAELVVVAVDETVVDELLVVVDWARLVGALHAKYRNTSTV